MKKLILAIALISLSAFGQSPSPTPYKIPSHKTVQVAQPARDIVTLIQLQSVVSQATKDPTVKRIIITPITTGKNTGKWQYTILF